MTPEFTIFARYALMIYIGSMGLPKDAQEASIQLGLALITYAWKKMEDGSVKKWFQGFADWMKSQKGE